jgi:hypothetical protein
VRRARLGTVWIIEGMRIIANEDTDPYYGHRECYYQYLDDVPMSVGTYTSEGSRTNERRTAV